MTNYEWFVKEHADFVKDLIINDICIDVKGNPQRCELKNCENCKFNKNFYDCQENKECWFDEMHTERTGNTALTKQDAIENHRKMWNWIANKTLEQKRLMYKEDYFEEFGLDEVTQLCYCCEYAVEHSSLHHEYFCKHCPIEWDSLEEHAMCVNKFFDCDDRGLYADWLYEEDYIESAKIALKIANLPERKEDVDGE